jgi:hypothetical protein
VADRSHKIHHLEKKKTSAFEFLKKTDGKSATIIMKVQ